VRFRQANAPWFYRAEMRRPPVLKDAMPTWSETWGIFGGKRSVTMPIVQTGARTEYDYDYAPDGKRLWKTARPKKAFVYFVNFSETEKARSRVKIDYADLGVDPAKVVFTKVDSEGRRTPFSREALEGQVEFPPNGCWGVELDEGR